MRCRRRLGGAETAHSAIGTQDFRRKSYRRPSCNSHRRRLPMVQSFRDLDVWRKSMDLVVQVYVVTERFPSSERFGLTSQMRRAAVSIPSNVAEGKALGGQGYRRHVKIALGSDSELQTQIELAARLRLFDHAAAAELLRPASEIGRMLAGLLRALPKGPA